MTKTHSLTTGDIAKYCDVNLRTVIRWVNKGSLKAYKLPGRGNNRIKVTDFLAFLVENGMPIPDELKPISRKALIVDDEASYANAIKRVLSKRDFDCRIANGGFQAGLMLTSEQPTVMTLDLSMPGLDGFEVIKFVRQTAAVAGTKILVISALNDDALQQAIALGADAALSKPFDNQELIDTVERMICE